MTRPDLPQEAIDATLGSLQHLGITEGDIERALYIAAPFIAAQERERLRQVADQIRAAAREPRPRLEGRGLEKAAQHLEFFLDSPPPEPAEEGSR